MQDKQFFYDILKKSSKTFYYSTLLFPKEQRDDVAVLYAFLRTVDDFVDAIPSQQEQYFEFKKEYNQALLRNSSKEPMIEAFIKLSQRKGIKEEWVNAVFISMEMDLHKVTYQTLSQTLQYIYGVAEVVGLMMARVLDLHEESFETAALFGRAEQMINIIRDIAEDIELGRSYFPKEELEKFGLENLTFLETSKKTKEFEAFMHFQLDRYDLWKKEAKKGFKYIPYHYLISIQSAFDIYNWTALQIRKDPLIVYRKKVRPSNIWIFTTIFKNKIKYDIKRIYSAKKTFIGKIYS